MLKVFLCCYTSSSQIVLCVLLSETFFIVALLITFGCRLGRQHNAVFLSIFLQMDGNGKQWRAQRATRWRDGTIARFGHIELQMISVWVATLAEHCFRVTCAPRHWKLQLMNRTHTYYHLRQITSFYVERSLQRRSDNYERRKRERERSDAWNGVCNVIFRNTGHRTHVNHSCKLQIVQIKQYI